MRKTYSDRLFIVDAVKGTIELNRDEARETKEYRTIIARDKGGKIKGDPDGRKKLLARKELYYVYIMADPFNMFAILNDKRRHKSALEETNLIELEGWKPDIRIKEAIDRYVKDYPKLSAIAKAYINSKKAIDNLGDDIALLNDYSDRLRQQIKDAKATIDDYDELEDEKQKAQADLNAYLKNLSSNNKEVTVLTSTLPDRIDALEKLKVKLSKEDTERDEVIGGGGTYRREEPK